jgi:hypothetical protein
LTAGERKNDGRRLNRKQHALQSQAHPDRLKAVVKRKIKVAHSAKNSPKKCVKDFRNYFSEIR